MDAYGPAVNDLKSLGTQKYTFGVYGPKQNMSTSLRTPVYFTKKTWAASDGSEREAAGLEPVVRPELGLPAHGSSPDPHAVVPRRAHGARLLGAVAVPPETVGASAAQDRRSS